MKTVALVLVSSLLVLAACSKSETPAAAASTAAAPTSAAATAPVTAAVVVDAVTGIADCDNFLSAYEQCVTEKAPAEVRTQLASGIGQWKAAWQSMAANDATKASLPQVCKQARDASAPSLQAYGCTL